MSSSSVEPAVLQQEKPVDQLDASHMPIIDGVKGSTELAEPTMSLQLVDENKTFNEDLINYITSHSDAKDPTGLNYHIVSVFGSQSTGKSTLLNGLFGTKFAVMDEQKRQQTTKGIWFSHANYIASDEVEGGKKPNGKNIYVLDVEGVDGREKADDKDFERKSALFALATSEVLIVNIWEHQVGLYQGANMELLKTVMEVNLSLFHKNRQKCLLLFVVRDFTGVTPLDNLSQSLTSDLERIWSELNRPEGCENYKLSDFFDLSFASIAHKHFQPEKFTKDIRQLGDEFTSDTQLLRPQYHRGIPIDAWAMYSQQIWDQIELNKDLDLPTQQILVARFRCDEISNNIYQEFLEQFDASSFDGDAVDVAKTMTKLRDNALASFDTQASRYQASVYGDRRTSLEARIDDKLGQIAIEKLETFSKELLEAFAINVQKEKRSRRSDPFADILAGIVSVILADYRRQVAIYQISSNLVYEKELQLFEAAVDETGEALKQKERAAFVSRTAKRFAQKFKERVVELLSAPTDNSWDETLQEFHDLENSVLDKHKAGDGYDLKLGLEPEENEATVFELKKQFWLSYKDAIHEFVTEDAVARILRNRFEDDFKYDDDGIPVMWHNVTEIDTKFSRARTTTIEMLPLLSVAKLSDGSVIVPEVSLVDEDDEYYLNDEERAAVSEFGKLLSTSQQNKVLHRLKKEIDAIYIDAKRSVIANRTSIPWYMYALVVVLGWNEFMAVIRNPLLVLLVVLVSTVLWFAYNTQMLGPMLAIAGATAQKTKQVAKQRLRDMLLDDETVSIEMVDLGKVDPVEGETAAKTNPTKSEAVRSASS